MSAIRHPSNLSRRASLFGKSLHCPLCENGKFIKGEALLNSRAATFLRIEWLNEKATYLECEKCGHLLWFKNPIFKLN